MRPAQVLAESTPHGVNGTMALFFDLLAPVAADVTVADQAGCLMQRRNKILMRTWEDLVLNSHFIELT